MISATMTAATRHHPRNRPRPPPRGNRNVSGGGPSGPWSLRYQVTSRRPAARSASAQPSCRIVSPFDERPMCAALLTVALRRRRRYANPIYSADLTNRTIHTRIAGVGHYLPERVVTNADLETTVDTSDQWIRDRTGIEERHIA